MPADGVSGLAAEQCLLLPAISFQMTLEREAVGKEGKREGVGEDSFVLLFTSEGGVLKALPRLFPPFAPVPIPDTVSGGGTEHYGGPQQPTNSTHAGYLL